MQRSRSLLAWLRRVDGQDLALIVGLTLLAVGLWRLADWGVAMAVIGGLLLFVWFWSLMAVHPPDRRR